MEELRLYRNDMTGQIVASKRVIDMSITKKDIAYYYVFDGQFIIERLYSEEFHKKYTPLPQPPAVGSFLWAVNEIMQEKPVHLKQDGVLKACMELRDGKIVVSQENKEKRLIPVEFKCTYDRLPFDVFQFTFGVIDEGWQLYEDSTPIIEKLPHEFVEGEDVLVKAWKGSPWERGTFGMLRKTGYLFPFECIEPFGYVFAYCLPYAGNEHLENIVTNGGHGKVPDGYVPPHVMEKQMQKHEDMKIYRHKENKELVTIKWSNIHQSWIIFTPDDMLSRITEENIKKYYVLEG